MTEDEKIEAACDWSDFRSEYGLHHDNATAEHRAFMAGWEAGRKGDQSSVLK